MLLLCKESPEKKDKKLEFKIIYRFKYTTTSSSSSTKVYIFVNKWKSKTEVH